MINDLAAILIVALGLVVFILDIHAWRICRYRWRWIYVMKALAGLLYSALFLSSIIDNNPSSTLNPLVARPVVVYVLITLVLSAVINTRTRGGC